MTKVRSTVTWAAVSVSAMVAVGALLSMQAVRSRRSAFRTSPRARSSRSPRSSPRSAASPRPRPRSNRRWCSPRRRDRSDVRRHRSGLSVAGADGVAVDVDIDGTISEALLAEIDAAGGTVIYASERWGRCARRCRSPSSTVWPPIRTCGTCPRPPTGVHERRRADQSGLHLAPRQPDGRPRGGRHRRDRRRAVRQRAPGAGRGLDRLGRSPARHDRAARPAGPGQRHATKARR